MLRIGIVEPKGYPQRALEVLRGVGTITLRGPEQNVAEFLGDVEAAVIRLKFFFDEALLTQAPRLRIIATATTGLDHIDQETARARGIQVLSLRGETQFLQTVTATAEHTWGLLLALIRHIPAAHAAVCGGDWDRTPFFGRELQGRTLGIVGLGRIGAMVARYGLVFRMRVIGFDPYQKEWVEGVERADSLAAAAEASDVLSVHVPLSKETEGLLGRAELGRLKGGAVVINTSRGAVLDEGALLDGLEAGRISGAALDVVQDEYSTESALRERLIRYAQTHGNLLITPHLGGATHDSLEKVEIFMAEKLARYARSTG